MSRLTQLPESTKMDKENRKSSLFGPYLRKHAARAADRAPKLIIKRIEDTVEKLDMPDEKKKALSGAIRQSLAEVWPGVAPVRTATIPSDEERGRQGFRADVQMTPGPVAWNHGAKLKYSYKEDDNSHKAKIRLGKTDSAKVSGELSSGLYGDSEQNINMNVRSEWTQAKGHDWNAGIEAERNSAGFNIRAAAGVEKNNGNKVAPYGSLEFRKQRGNWEVKGGFIIKKDSKGAILEVRKAF